MSIHMNRETAGANAPTVEILLSCPDQSRPGQLRPDWLTSFEPIPLLRGGHAQTLAGNYWRRPLFLLPFVSQAVEVDPVDGSRVLCHCHWQPEAVRADRLTIFLVHGLEGSSDSRYIKGITMRAWEAGCNVVRMNMRNCGGTDTWTPTLYHSGLSADVHAVLHFFVSLYDLRRVAMAGYSMGGNLVLKLAGELADQPPAWLLAAVGVSPAADLAASADALHEPANRIYEWHFLRNLMKRFQRKAGLFPEIYSTHGIGPVRSVREFDDRITARYSGFTGADDYYFRASAARVVDRISIPTLVLHALDDPFIRMMPQTREALTLNPATTLVETAHGGHCAFLARKPASIKALSEVQVATFEDSRHWAEETLVRFLLAHAGHPRGG
jgi:predicted alpha/beta-fold hydrolase